MTAQLRRNPQRIPKNHPLREIRRLTDEALARLTSDLEAAYSRFTEEQIIGFLREADAGVPIKDLCRRHGFAGRRAITSGAASSVPQAQSVTISAARRCGSRRSLRYFVGERIVPH